MQPQPQSLGHQLHDPLGHHLVGHAIQAATAPAVPQVMVESFASLQCVGGRTHALQQPGVAEGPVQAAGRVQQAAGGPGLRADRGMIGGPGCSQCAAGGWCEGDCATSPCRRWLLAPTDVALVEHVALVALTSEPVGQNQEVPGGRSSALGGVAHAQPAQAGVRRVGQQDV